MRAPIVFTTTAIDRLDLAAGENDVWIWDADGGQHSGLGVRMRRGQAGTSKTWYGAYRFAGQDRRDRLGDLADYSLADARHRVYELRRDAADAIDPREKKAASVADAVKAVSCPVFADYVEHYLRRKEPKVSKARYREIERYLARTIADDKTSRPNPYFGSLDALRLDQITKAKVAERINFLEDTGVTKPSVTVAQAARMALMDVFKLAIKEGHITVNPVKDTPQPCPPNQQKARDRTLDGAELAALWNASDDGDYGKITRLAILLGGRRQEIGGMRWSEIDAAGNWTLPEERSKNGRALTLPLPPVALDIVRSMPHRDGRDQIFGDRSPDGFTLWSAAKHQLDARLPLKPWVFHDLRRTVATEMNELGILPHIVEQITNHAELVDEKRSKVHRKHYNHAAYTTQKADALLRWSEYVMRLASGTSNVVELDRARAA